MYYSLFYSIDYAKAIDASFDRDKVRTRISGKLSDLEKSSKKLKRFPKGGLKTKETMNTAVLVKAALVIQTTTNNLLI